MNDDDRVVLHRDETWPMTEKGLDLMFAKARAAFILGLGFTIESHPRLTITVHVDRAKIAEAHYTEQARLATEEQNRDGLAATRAALRDLTGFSEAQAQHLAEGLGALGLANGNGAA